MSGPRIRVVNPNTTASMTASAVAAARRAAPHATVEGSTPSRGVDSVESHVDEVWGALGVLEQVLAGERAGTDAYVVACFGDTGVPAAREVARGPVVGMTEAALLTAALVAHRFTVVTLPRRTREQSDRVVGALGLGHRCVVRAVDVPVAEVHEDSTHLLETFVEQGRLALEEDAAEALVLGCAGLTDLVDPLRARLGVPVVEGVAAATTLAVALLAQGVGTSRAATWAAPERLGPVGA
ncbi:allantoin racemase [Motilibacter rhizosphaerae]|uniref:Allantoin racemase n=1 Tax=Motilibacter rhizosphaerae TaxID=598652 RepID=A0A4Q7NRU1_9ACTN|nr:aspartate/glutamate racemase family protein [Motilibacter rhizosphaerae]RZS89705.1 allantoin racemase [Motilibacter rhizosphaerae]